MANYATLKAAIQSVITTNGNNEITGEILQQTLLSIINSLGANYQFCGVATPATNPGTPDQNVAYIAGDAGTYSNMGGGTLESGQIGIFTYNGTWALVALMVGKNYDEQMAAISDLFIYSRNLLNVDESTLGYRLNASTGELVADSSVDLSTYIAVDALATYAYQCLGGEGTNLMSVRWYAYDQNKNYLSQHFSSASTYVVPSGVKYVRVAYAKQRGTGSVTNQMVFKGSSVTTYEQYYKLINPAFLPVDNDYNVDSDNFLPNRVIADTILNGNGYGIKSIPTQALAIAIAGKNKLNLNDPDFIVGRLITATGTTANSDGASSGFIPVTPGQAYLFYSETSAEYAQDPTVTKWRNCRWNAYDANKNVISGVYISSANQFTVPAGASYIRIGITGYATNYNYMVVLKTSDDVANSINYEPFKWTLDIRNISLSEQNNDAGFMALWKNTLALPPIKCFVGYPVNIYLQNIVDYFKDSFYFRVGAGYGKLTSKKWTYTPESAGTISLRFIYLDHQMNELNDDSVSIQAVAASQKSSLTVLVIGDSTVNLATSLPGGGETQKMLDLAAADNYPLTLLGTRGTGANQHEGRGGWTAKMYCTQASAGSTPNAFWNPNTSKFDFSYYMAQQGYSGVDCVFIQLGINDMTSLNLQSIVTDEQAEAAIADMFTYMDEMITSIHQYNSSIKIVINTTIPCTNNQDVWRTARQPAWRHKRNTYLLNVASLTHYANMSNVFVSWYAAALDVENLTDSVHPNQDGFDQLGEQMYSFMRAIN